MQVNSEPREINLNTLVNDFQPGDVLVINNTRVVPQRIFFSSVPGDILFLQPSDKPNLWQGLTHVKKIEVGQWLELNGGARAKLIETGRIQLFEVDQELTADYFFKHGELAIPPYILKARGSEHDTAQDKSWYQTEWAEVNGSIAAPTASLHFTKGILDELTARGVIVEQVTLHVGAGTFLPVKSETLAEHQMHSEWCRIPRPAQESILRAKEAGKRVWALGTTVVRTLESWGAGKLSEDRDIGATGPTDLFIYPGFDFKIVDRLMTNFHQPRSTLIALVSAFAGREKVLDSYAWAIARGFRLFSYGDLTVWKR